MIPDKKLRQLQARCQGEEKDDLYHLLGVRGQSPGHEELVRLLRQKQRSWSSKAGTEARLKAVELALELLKTPQDKDQYDRFRLAEAEGSARAADEREDVYRPAGRPPRPYRPPPAPRGKTQRQQWTRRPPRVGLLGLLANVIFFGPIKLLVWLAMVAVGLAVLAQATTGLLNRLTSSTTSDGEIAGGDPPAAEDPGRDPAPVESPAADLPEVEPAPADPAPADPAPADPPPVDRVPMHSLTVDLSPPRSTLPQNGPPPLEDSSPLESPPADEPPPVQEPVRVGGSMTPRKTWNVPAEYPRLERLRRIEGDVILEVTVDHQGDVSNVSVLRASVEGLAEAAVEAARQWRYEPTVVNGRTVSVVLTETVRFQIRN